MTPWFTVERIDDATFALSEYRHWEETHSYLLLGRDRALLLDTGLGVGGLRREVEALTDRPVTVTLTHVHWDHIGGCVQFAAPAVHEAEADWLRHFPLPEAAVRARDGFRRLRERGLLHQGAGRFDFGDFQVHL